MDDLAWPMTTREVAKEHHLPGDSGICSGILLLARQCDGASIERPANEQIIVAVRVGSGGDRISLMQPHDRVWILYDPSESYTPTLSLLYVV